MSTLPSSISRKINPNKWSRDDHLAEQEIPATVANDLNATGNALSLWSCALDDSRPYLISFLVFVVGAERLDKYAFVWADTSHFSKSNLKVVATKGATTIEALKDSHVDIQELDIGRLHKAAEVLWQAFNSGNMAVLTKVQVTTLIAHCIHKRYIALSDLKYKVEDIDAIKAELAKIVEV